ncbi:MAG TPA: hypothetical protein VL354_02815 [Spirochaetia bacterium]|nr:hypothetical protein [Spirochaetia bacterium]
MKKLCVLAILLTLVLTSCPAPGGGGGQNNPPTNQILQGTINSTSFTFDSGYAGTDSIDATLWTVNLYKISPASGLHTWDSGAYPPNEYPYLFFSIQKSSSPQAYQIVTLGTLPNMALWAWIGGSNFVGFDSGQLTITKIDLTANVIAGTITATTTDGKSSLSGSFSVDIDPVSH